MPRAHDFSKATVLGGYLGELDESSCRLSRTPSLYNASFAASSGRAGLITIFACGGCGAAQEGSWGWRVTP